MSNNNNLRFYRHYKNKPYKYIGVVRHSETLEEMALYETLYENNHGRMWVRPKDMFFEDIELNGVKRPRFEKVQFEFKTLNTIDETTLQQVAVVYQQAFGKAMDLVKVKSVIETHTQFFAVLVYESKNLVGFKLGYVRDQYMFYSWLGGVLPAYRSLGVASELMRMQHQWCVDKKFKKILTHTRNKFPEMIALNLKHGFEIVGTVASKDRPIKLIMEKVL
ncbi:GNAT family N-acetyltransferase [bacterium]|nr:GNAT family N-acetyltransferase [bacterium]